MDVQLQNLIGIETSNKPFSDESGLPLTSIQFNMDISQKTALSLPGKVVLLYGLEDTTLVIYLSLLNEGNREARSMVQWRIQNAIITTNLLPVLV